jgi:micrococcal nuclease
MSFFIVFLPHIVSSYLQNVRFRIPGCCIRPGLVFILITLLLAGCQDTRTQSVGAIPRTETVALPTANPTPKPSPVSTRVLPVEVLTPPSTLTLTPIPDDTLGLVVDVIDGETIAVVMDGDPIERTYAVRYLGIDVPANSSIAPWGVVAYETNRKLTNLKVVRLVRDQTDFDPEGYLLRYVYIDDQMMNIILTEQGLAKAAIEEPDIQFKAEILDAETRAREGDLGLWGEEPPTPTSTPGQPRPSEAEPTTESPVGAPTAAVEATVDVTTTATTELIDQPTVVPNTVTSTPDESP